MPIKTLAAAALVALAAVPLALAHNDATGADSVSPNPACNLTQVHHDYVMVGALVYGTRTTGVGSAGVMTTLDGNAGDCDGDGVTGDDFDGDRELGFGGASLPSGPWAGHDLCDYGMVSHHGAHLHVHSEFPDETTTGLFAHFTVGADPTTPTFVPTVDPSDDDGVDCITDGSVTPGDADPDDWLQGCIHICLVQPPPDNTNPVYGQPGGDGAYAVWINCVARTMGDDLVDWDDPANFRPSPPTSVESSCSGAGHVTAT